MTNPQTPTYFAPPHVENEQNVHFRARTTVTLANIPAHYELKVAAESWYRLWCNGEEVSTGPARGTSALNFFDTLDLATFLRTGENTIEILVGCHNIPTFKAAPARPAVWVEVEGQQPAWQVAIDTAFDKEAKLYNWHTGYAEYLDLRVTELDWQAPEFFAIDKQLLPRDVAFLEQKTYSPPSVRFPLTIEPGTHVVLDFEREIIGGAQLQVDAAAGSTLEFGYVEYLDEGKMFYFEPDRQLTYTDKFITRSGKQTLGASLQERGFRYLQLTLASDASPLVVEAASAIDRRHPLAAPTFSCPDERLNRLYQMAHYTVSSCVTDVITDCPWREATLWVNDMVVNVPFWLEAGGDPQVVARCLRLALSEHNEDGLIYGLSPSAKREEIVFLATNAFLPLMLEDLAKFDKAMALSLLQPVTQIMRNLAQFEDEDGLLIGAEKYWNFIDWAFDNKGWNTKGRASASMNWFYVLALDAMSKLYESSGAPDGEFGYSYWRERANKTAGNLCARFWDTDKMRYREFEGEEDAWELPQALAVLSGREPNATALLEKLASDDDELLKPELYMMHFVIRALVENGYNEPVKARLEHYWGSILDTDSLTIWEANVYEYGRYAFGDAGSLCHAFACSPLWAIPRLYPQQ